MKKLALVYNPVSGKAVFKNKLDDIIQRFQARNCCLVPYRTEKGNARLADFLRMMDFAGVLVAGGDGTLHELINTVVHEHLSLPIAILPSGTSNDFAAYLGLDHDKDIYYDHIAAGRVRPVDLGIVGTEYFINVAGAGMLTSIAHEVDVRLKNALGKMAYYINGFASLPHFHALKLHIQADDQVLAQEAFFFVIVNSGVVGSFKNAAVKAKIDDGLLDMIIVKKCNAAELMRLTFDLLSGHDVSQDKSVIYIQAASFKITAEETLESDLDGEKGPALPLYIDTLPAAIELFY